MLKIKHLYLYTVLILASSCGSNIKEGFSCVHFDGISPTDSSLYAVLDNVTQYQDSLHELEPEEMVYTITCLYDDDTIIMISSCLANICFPSKEIYGFIYKDILFVVIDYSECDSIFFLPSGIREEHLIKQNNQETCLIDDSWNEWAYRFKHGKYTPLSFFINGLKFDKYN